MQKRKMFLTKKRYESDNGSYLFFMIGPFRGGNKPPVLPGEEKGFSKAKTGELKAAEVVANN